MVADESEEAGAPCPVARVLALEVLGDWSAAASQAAAESPVVESVSVPWEWEPGFQVRRSTQEPQSPAAVDAWPEAEDEAMVEEAT